MTTTTFITDQKGKKISAVLPIKAYKQMLEELEELEDIRAYDKAKAKKEKPILLSDAVQQRRKKQKPEYTVLILPSVQKQLDKLPNNTATRIEDKLIMIIAF